MDGSLCIRSPRTALGYVGAQVELRDAEGFVDTGDIVELRGDRYYFVGRKGGIINVGGLKISPRGNRGDHKSTSERAHVGGSSAAESDHGRDRHR